MDYNELKFLILRALSEVERPVDSVAIAGELGKLPGWSVDVHALRMALMRYYKLGLLKRERVGGMFQYSLSERGERRLRWLESQRNKIE